MEYFGINLPSALQALLKNPSVTDICLNGGNEVFFDRGNGLELCHEASLSEARLREWVLSELSAVGKTWDAKYPFVDATLPSGHRAHIVFPSSTQEKILVSLRRLTHSNEESEPNGDSQGSRGSRWCQSPESTELYRCLVQAVQKGDSILLSGATGSGKTTLASDLLSEVPSHERMIALEDTPELSPRHPHFLRLLSRPPTSDGYGEITLRTLLKQTLRMRPDRIILGECRGNEVLDLLQALNTGHRGALATLHANSPRDALRRIELLCLLAVPGALPLFAIRELLSLGIQWIAQVKRVSSVRKISEVWKVEGREGDTILMRPVLKSKLS